MAMPDTGIVARIAPNMAPDMAAVILPHADTIAPDMPTGRAVQRGTRAALELIAEGANSPTACTCAISVPHPFAPFLAKGWEATNLKMRIAAVRDLAVHLRRVERANRFEQLHFAHQPADSV